MKSIVRILARLYPASWRARYGAEFDVLLEDVRPSTRQAMDVVLGAMSMQMTTWNFGKIVGVSALAGLAAASIGAFLRPAQYDSSTKIEIYGSDDAAQSAIDGISRVILSRETFAGVIQKFNLYPRERSDESLDELVTRMEKAVTVHSVKANTPVRKVTLDFKYSDPKIAQEVNADLVQKIQWGSFKMEIASPVVPHPMAVVPGPSGLPTSLSGPGEYDSSTTFQIYGSDIAVQSLMDNVFKSTLSRESLAAVIQRHNLYEGERGHQSPDQLVTRLSKAITIQSVMAGPSDALGMRNLTLEFKYSDPKVAQQVDGDLVSQLMSRNLTTREATPGGPPIQFHVPEAPSLPLKPSGPGWPLVTVGGAMAGALCGLVVASLLWFGRRSSPGVP
jgi:hypothetical protein